MNTLAIEAKLAQKYNYQRLPEEEADKYIKLYTDNIPKFLLISGGHIPLFTSKGTIITEGYKRIVIGHYGAFIEFDYNNAYSGYYVVQPGQEYRINDPKYSKNVKYIWYTINDGSNIKIYYQKKKVNYADYLPKNYYVSVH